MHAEGQALYVSENGVEGSLADAPLDELLARCRQVALTGFIRVYAVGEVGVAELRAGVLTDADFLGFRGEAALLRMRALRNGGYDIVQRLPELDGALGSADEFRGEVADVPLVEVMRHCEENALSCTITVIHDFDRGQIHYRGGELVDIDFNGEHDEGKILAMVRFPEARFRVKATPLALMVDGQPREPRSPAEPELEPEELGPEPTVLAPPVTVRRPAPNVYIAFLDTAVGKRLLAKAARVRGRLRALSSSLRSLAQ